MHFKQTNDSLIKLHEFKSKYTIMFFYDISCPGCLTKVPKVNSLAKKYPGIKFLGMYYGASFDDWLNYIQNNNLKDWINLCKANPGADLTMFMTCLGPQESL